MLPPLDTPPAATTVLDLQHEEHPEFFSRAELRYRQVVYGWTVRRSRLVITISEHAASTLVRKLGVAVTWLTAPVEICGDGCVWALELEKMRLGEPDASGRRRPEPIAGSRYELPFDTVIRAVGQAGPTDVLDDLGVKVDGTTAVADAITGATTADDILNRIFSTFCIGK